MSAINKALVVMCPFIIIACSGFSKWLYPPKVNITAQEIHSYRQRALYLAEKKLKDKAEARGCSLSKGRRFAWTQKVGHGFRGSVSYTFSPDDCDVKKCLASWTREESRTQAGGWIWFPGKGKGETEDSADLNAKGQALNQLVQECEVIPKGTKFHERCVDEIGNSFVVHVRASVKKHSCEVAKHSSRSNIGHKALTRVLQRYNASK